MKILKAFPFIAAITSALVLSSCSSDSVTLRLIVDENYSANTVSEMTMSISMESSMDSILRTMTTDMSFDMGLSGKEPTAEGNQILSVSIEKVRMNMQMDSLKIAYDSENIDHAITEQEMAYHSMLGSRIDMEMTDRGDLVQIANMEEFVDNMIEKMGIADSGQAPMYKAMIMQQLSGEQVQSQFGLNNLAYPEEAISVGSTWSTDIHREAALPLVINTTYTVTKITAESVYVSTEGVAEVAEGAMPGMNVTGTMVGTMVIDRASGWVSDSEGVMDFNSHVEMGENIIDMNISGTYHIQTN